jgi:hypothetical protein
MYLSGRINGHAMVLNLSIVRVKKSRMAEKSKRVIRDPKHLYHKHSRTSRNASIIQLNKSKLYIVQKAILSVLGDNRVIIK